MIIWTGLYKITQYYIDMYYSTQVVPGQLDDDGSYQWIKIKPQIDSIAWWVYFAGIVLLIILIIKMWVKYSKQEIEPK